MAWIDQGSTGVFNLRFRYDGQHYTRSLQTSDEREAKDLLGQARQTLRNIKLGAIAVPEDADLATFILSAGKTGSVAKPKPIPTLTEMMNAYFASLPEGGLERSTIDGMKIHQKQLESLIGSKKRVSDITKETLQDYINARSKQKAKPKAEDGKRVSAVTVKKAIVTLRTIWNWAIEMKMISRTFPGRKLMYPKGREKQPFQTREEIERQLKGLSAIERMQVEPELWESLYLTDKEIDELLKYVEKHARQPFIYPLFVAAAHTGPRRAELARAAPWDVDLAGGYINYHERKKSHDKRTQRRVPLSALLKRVLTKWLKEHPGGSALFCQSESNRKKQRTGPTPVTRNELQHHLKETLAGSKWQVVKGWHVLRHSFISVLASKGTDQRIIDDFVGHCTEEQRKRYRHLYPNVTRQAINNAFS